MNSPLIIFNNMLAQEVLDQIQQYLPVNENIRTALASYYDKLYDKKVIDDDEAFEIHNIRIVFVRIVLIMDALKFSKEENVLCVLNTKQKNTLQNMRTNNSI